MTLEQIFYLTQSVAAIGVVASLVFLGLQTRDSAKAVRSATTQAVQDNYATWYRSLSEHPSLLLVHAKGFVSPDSLTIEEKLQFFASYTSIVFHAENAFRHWREDHLPREAWLTWEKGLLLSMHYPGGKLFWIERRHLFSEEFQAEVDAARPQRPNANAKLFGVIPLPHNAPEA